MSNGMTSVVYSCLELARRLAADGHQVVFAGLEERRALAERLGLEFLELQPSRYDDFLHRDSEKSLLIRMLRMRKRQQEALRSLNMAGFAQALRRLAPDLALIDGEMHEHIVVSAGSGVRTVLLNTFCSIWRRPGLPPPHTLVRPGVGWRGTRAGVALYWLALRLRKRLRWWKLLLRHVGCDRISLLRDLARRHDFDLRAESDAGQWLIPWTYRSLPALSLHALEFDFPHEPPEHVRYVGPMVLRDRGDEPPAETARLDALLQENAQLGRKLIYAGFGSSFTARSDLVLRLAAAAECMPWDLVVSLAGADQDDVAELPENVHAFRWLPQLRVLERADVAVVHGGINTIDECVLHGVPMLVYCGFETDMAGNTARVVHHGLGLAGDPHGDGPAEIRRHVETLLGDATYRDTVKLFRARYERYEKDRIAERVALDLLR